MSEIDAIYKELAAKITGGRSETLPKILAKMANLEQARLIAALPDTDRSPAAGRSLEVSDKFAQKLGLDKKTVDKHIRELYEKGLLFPTRTGPQMARTYMQLHDAALGNPKYDEALGTEFFDLWGGPDGKITRKPSPASLRPRFSAFRIVPRWKSIKDLTGVLPHEDIRQILKSQDQIALQPCGCKRSFRKRDCGIPVESCINVGRTAEYNIDRGASRKITYEEAMKINDEFDKYPVVNAVVNQREVNQLICNCHYCCCGAIHGAAKSRFEAEVDPEKCHACGICVDSCQFGAISMKQYPGIKGERAYVNPELCRGCGCCVIACPNEARKMKIVRPPEHIPESGAIY
jgi:Pyruvate/2-oxoacid:ferredoxin oxidoreductase delta subunit